MFMVASSVVLTVLVLNYHHRSPDRYVMPNWVRDIYAVNITIFILQLIYS